ncbi:hypothetical protein D3C85_1519610 [compost metagenome]
MQHANGLGLGQPLLHVLTEKSPWREQFADRHMLLIGLRPAAGRDVPGQPLGEVVGVVRVDAHARRVAVEGMAQLDRAIRLAPAQFGTGFDHQHRSFPGQA